MSNPLSEVQKQDIAKKLRQKGISLICPMCSNKNFTLADGYFNHTLQVDLKSISLGGPSIPTVAIICGNCGFISQHAIGALGLLDQNK